MSEGNWFIFFKRYLIDFSLLKLTTRVEIADHLSVNGFVISSCLLYCLISCFRSGGLSLNCLTNEPVDIDTRDDGRPL